VQREGGKTTMDDLAAYQALWTEPAIVDFRGYQIASLGQPSEEGMLMQWSFALAEKANFKERGHYTT
jgi:gamma-glutamyltranspeptidase/glutathione hydrolase